MIGYTDMICGAVPADAEIGWSSVVNPQLKLAYLAFFRGDATAEPNDVILNLTNLWMQYGGRSYLPWASYKGGTDLTFALGTENATGAFVNGLEYSLENPEVLGRPTTVTIDSGGSKRLLYGTGLFEYSGSSLDHGVARVEKSDSGLALTGTTGANSHLRADRDFRAVTEIAAEIDNSFEAK